MTTPLSLVPEGILRKDDPTITPADPYAFTDYYPNLAAIVRAVNPEGLLEFGVRYGYSLAVMLDAAPRAKRAAGYDFDNPGGRYTDPPPGALAEARAALEEARPRRWPRLKELSVTPLDTAAAETLPQDWKADLAYLDASHDAPGLLHELDLAQRALTPRGVIVVDDTDMAPALRLAAAAWGRRHGFSVQHVSDASRRGRVVLCAPARGPLVLGNLPKPGRRLEFLVPPGIGDVSWLYSKLCHLPKLLDCEVVLHAPGGETHDRSIHFFDLLPQITKGNILPGERNPYGRGIPASTTLDGLDALVGTGPVPLECNSHLEAGRRLEEFLPEVPCAFHYPLAFKEADRAEATDALAALPRPITLGYVSGRHTQHGEWKLWSPDEWAYVLNGVASELSGSVLMVGAAYDREHTQDVLDRLTVPYTAMIDRPLGVALAALSMCDVQVTYPSGIGILANVLSVPGLMLLPESLEKLSWAYADPEDQAQGRYAVWTQPEPESARRYLAVLGRSGKESRR